MLICRVINPDIGRDPLVDTIQRHRSRNGAAPAAHGAIAAADINQPFWQIEFQFYGTAVAGRPMLWLYFNAIYFR